MEHNQRIEELENQVKRFNLRFEKLKKISRTFSLYRLFIFLLTIAVFLILFIAFSQTAAYISIAVFAVIFGIVTQKHNSIDNSIRKNIIWVGIKQTNIARIKIDWSNIPFNNEILSDDFHPFESDLNISGRNSLLHLIDTCVSKEGSSLLRNWLINTKPNYDAIINRQSLIKELIPLAGFRAHLNLASGMASKDKLDGRMLTEELIQHGNIKKIKNILKLLSIIIPINILLFILFMFWNIPAFFGAGLIVQLGIYWFNIAVISELFERAVSLEDKLGKFSGILDFLENYNYSKNVNLKKLCEPILENNFRPSKKFKAIGRVIYAVSLQKNIFTSLLFNILFPWDFYFAYRLEKIKEEISAQLPSWLESWYNLEALSCFANIAYLNPEYTFPSIVTKPGNDTLFSVTGMGHPLIPFAQNVKNSFSIEKTGDCIIITGSNMSGKSTFLRTVGLNLALCYAGAPVLASSFDTSLFRLFTCIKINDSVTDGISYFYAEVKRLKLLLNELKREDRFPLFYLIDEIFRGTNNLERLIGSRSFIKELAGSNSMGLISTHDLELVKLEDEIKNIFNFHFREDVAGDKMIFDYKIRKGPSPTTNALKIMKLEGLPVDKF